VPDARVAGASQAAALLAVELRPLVTLLMRRACTVSEVASELGIHLNRAHYLTTKLLRAGVAEVSGIEARSGRGMKRYVVAPHWFVPFDVTDAVTLQDFAGAQLIPRLTQMLDHAVPVFQSHAGGRAGYWVEEERVAIGDHVGPAEGLFTGDEPFLFDIGQLRLSPERASDLKRRLTALLREFAQNESPAGSPYGIGIMLVRGEVV